MTEFGPRGRTAGRYCGSCAEAGAVEGEPDGRAAGEAAGFNGLAEGFTSTSAAKSVSRPIAAAARINQNLSIECLRNAVLALSQDQFFARDDTRSRSSYFLCEWFPWPFPWPDGFAKECGRDCTRVDRIRGFTMCSGGGGVADCCAAALAFACDVCSDKGIESSIGSSLF